MKNRLVLTAIAAALVLAVLWAAHHVDAMAFVRQLHGG